MRKVNFIARTEGSDEEFVDEAIVLGEGDLEAELKIAVSQFNEEEKTKYGKKARQRIFVRLVGLGNPIHEWHKVSLMGQRDAVSIYDLWRCGRCGLVRRVRSVNAVPSGGDCFPDRTCAPCSRVFKTAENLEKHKQTAIHKWTAEGRG